MNSVMKVEQFIRHDVPTIAPDATFQDALAMMIEEKTNGLVVVDEENRPLGTIDSFDLIHAAVPGYLRHNTNLAQFAAEGVFHAAVTKSLEQKVVDLMEDLDGKIMVQPQDPMIFAATLASRHNTRYVPVVDEKGGLIGLVSRTGIKRAMAELLSMEDDD